MRVGADAGDYKISERVIRSVKDSGIKSFYSLMKAYLLTPKELAKEAEILENMGVDEITIMDSAGFMQPEQAREYVVAMKEKVHIPVGFHGHNNLGLHWQMLWRQVMQVLILLTAVFWEWHGVPEIFQQNWL